MAAVSFSDGNALYDITPVENIFILEYMANVPGDYIKVYLLGLTMCYHSNEDYSISQMAKELSLSSDEVKEAYTYWAQIGLVTIESRRPFNVVYHNIKKEKMQKSQDSKVNLYTHQPLVLELQRIFGGRRLLGSGEVNYVMTWLEEWNVPQEVISLVAAWCVEMKSEKVRFSYINKVLGDIYDQGLVAYSEVEGYIREVSGKMSGAADVLKAWNISRPPTADEISLYKTWISKYKMQKAAIREAQKHMTGISNPNFKYLGTIIDELHENNVKTADEALRHFQRKDALRSDAKEVFSILGGLRVTEGRIKLYESWIDLGFTQRSILTAAEELSKTGDRQPDDLDSVLKRWHKNGILDEKSVAEYMTLVKMTRKKVADLLDTWGVQRAPKTNEIAIYNTWIQKKYPNELIALACEKSASANDKMQYANKILSNWENQGVKNAKQAESSPIKTTGVKKEAEIPEDDYFSKNTSWEEI